MLPNHNNIMLRLKGGNPERQPIDLTFSKSTKPTPASSTPILDKAVASVDTTEELRGLSKKAYDSVKGFVQEWGRKNAEEQAGASGVKRTGIQAKQGLRLGRTVVREAVAGGVTLAKSLAELAGIPKGNRSEEQQAALEQIIFGRPVKSIQEGYVVPAMQATVEQGSGAVETGLIAAGAGLGGLFLEAPGNPMRKPARDIIDVLATVKKPEQVRTLLNISVKNKQVDDLVGLIAKEKDPVKVEALATDLRRSVRSAEAARKFESADEMVAGQRQVFRGESTGSKNMPDFGNARYVSENATYAKSHGPVRTGYVPADAKLINAERPITEDLTKVIQDAASDAGKAEVTRILATRPTATFREVWKAASDFGKESDRINGALERAGFDGIEYLAARREGDKTITNLALFDDANVIDEDTLRTSFDAAKQEAVRPKPEKLDLPKYQAAIDAQSSVITNFQETVQDSLARLKAIVNDPDVKISEESNPYLREELYHGRVDTLLQDGRAQYEGIVDALNDVAGKYGVNATELDTVFNDYLIARHAPERNAKLKDGAAGITTAEARDILNDIASKPYSKDLEAVAEKFYDFNRKTLDILRDTGVITRELHETLTSQYKHYVPLNRVMDGDADLEARMVGGIMDVRGTGIRAAKGSDKEVRDVLGNATANYQDAVMRGEKNIVLNSLYKFVEDNPELDLFSIRKPRAIGESFAAKDGTRRPIMEQLNDPRIIALRKDGKPAFVEVKDLDLAQAIQGINIQDVPKVMRFAAAGARLLSGLYTRFSPDFALANKIRDLQEVVIYLASQKDMTTRKALRASVRNIETTKAVTDWHLGRDTEGAKLYDQMRHDGGITGGASLVSRGDIELDINKYRKLSRSNTRKGFDKLIRSVDSWNAIFEDSTRFATYKTALDQGLSRERAASLAKNASINFNRKGTGGSLVNALYIFSNASIQGSFKLLSAMKNPKVATSVLLSIGTAVYATNEWNDQVDPEWRNKVTEWDRTNGLPVVMPSTDGTFRYFTIPVSWGIKPINVMWNTVSDLTNGEAVDTRDALERIGAAVLNSYNPFGGTDMLSAAVPTLLDPFVDIGRNKSWTGSPIMPSTSKYTPDSLRYFDMLRDSASGRLAIDISKGLSGLGVEVSPATLKYLYDQYTGGPGKFATRISDMVKAAASPEDEVELDQVPILSRFYRERTGEEIGAGGKLYLEARTRLEGQARATAVLSEQAEEAWSQLKDMDDQAYTEHWNKLVTEDRELAKKVKEISDEEAMGLTYTDRLVKQMNVKDGVRAQFIADELRAAKTDEEYIAIWNSYVEKKLITKDVAKQVRYYLSNEN